MNYDPPDDEDYKKAYDNGYNAAKSGLNLDDNPYPLSGHPRDMDFNDNRHFHWYSGWSDYND